MRPSLLVMSLVFAVNLPNQALGLQIIGSGVFTDDSGRAGKWRAELTSAGVALDGQLVLSGESGRTTALLEGRIDLGAGRFDCTVTNDEGLSGNLVGHLSGASIEGKFHFDGIESGGTWEGEWRPASGEPAPELVQISPPATASQAREMVIIDDYADDPCGLLEAAGQAFSGSLYAAVARACAEQLESSFFGQTSPTLLSLLALPRVGWMQTALAQAPPLANVLAVNRLDPYPLIRQVEPSVAVSPLDSNRVVVAYVDHAISATRTGYSTSANGASSWDDQGPISSAPGFFNSGDPVLATDSQGYFYLATLEADLAAFTSKILVRRSIDTTGVMFGAAVVAGVPAAGATADKPEMAIDRIGGTYNGRIYVCWNDSGGNQQIRFSYSSDGGDMFNDPNTPITDPMPSALDPPRNCSVAVGPTGHVYLSWWDGNSQTLQIVRSEDGGESFIGVPCCASPNPPGTSCPSAFCPRIATALKPPPDAFCGSPGSPALNGHIRNRPAANLATDPLRVGNVYAVWDSWSGNSSEVMFSKSINHGAWSGAVILNNALSGDQFQPRITTRVYTGQPDTTEIRVVWYDRRRDAANLAYDVYYDTSFNRGMGWAADTRLSNTSSPIPLPQLVPDLMCTASCFFGDYIGVQPISPNGSDLFITAWSDSRLTADGQAGTCTNGTQYPSSIRDLDIVTAVGC